MEEYLHRAKRQQIRDEIRKNELTLSALLTKIRLLLDPYADDLTTLQLDDALQILKQMIQCKNKIQRARSKLK